MISINELKTYLNLPDILPEGYEDILKHCILASVSEMNIYTNRDLVTLDDDLNIITPEKTEYHSGYGTNFIFTKNFPVIEIGNDPANIQFLNNDSEWKNLIDGDTLEGKYYIIQPSVIKLTNGNIFPEGNKNIKLIYTPGYTSSSLPAILKNVCYEKSAMKFHYSNYENLSRLGISYKTISSNQWSFISVSHDLVLSQFRRKI